MDDLTLDRHRFFVVLFHRHLWNVVKFVDVGSKVLSSIRSGTNSGPPKNVSDFSDIFIAEFHYASFETLLHFSPNKRHRQFNWYFDCFVRSFFVLTWCLRKKKRLTKTQTLTVGRRRRRRKKELMTSLSLFDHQIKKGREDALDYFFFPSKHTCCFK